ncbi:MAG: hypothetical protein IKR86_11210 [Candidatus Methanomethylophilaceae archaeon]|nr:hypothetical protein [Candidatus Methanomethylophilaceae archaeon]
MRVLTVLLENGVCNLSGLKEAIGNPSTRKSTILRLKDLGLVDYELDNSTHLSYRVSLTSLGMQTAVIMALGKECMEGTLDLERDSLDEKVTDMLAVAKSKISKSREGA